MESSMDNPFVREVMALVSTTAKAACTRGEDVPSMELQFYEVLAIHCAEKQRLADAEFANGAAARASKGLIYW